MADTACLMHGSSYASLVPNEPMQGNAKHALGDSISFGRFMTDQSLSWEKWSTFPHKKHVEEAVRYSQPGSVAQKKAFFEAHYKEIAAQKAAALLEQEYAAEAESKGAVDNYSVSDVKMEEVKIQDAKKDRVNDEHSTIAVIKHGKDGGNAVITGNEASRESPAKKNSINRKRSSAKSLLSLMNLLSVSTKGVSMYTEPNTESEDTRDKKPLDTPAPGSKARPKGCIKSAVCSKTLRTDERAAKRKQEKAGHKFRKLSCSFCFKAQPMVDDESYKNGDAPRTQIEKTPEVQIRPAELERSNSKKMHASISVPSPPPPPPPTFLVKNSPSKNFSKK